MVRVTVDQETPGAAGGPGDEHCNLGAPLYRRLLAEGRGLFCPNVTDSFREGGVT